MKKGNENFLITNLFKNQTKFQEDLNIVIIKSLYKILSRAKFLFKKRSLEIRKKKKNWDIPSWFVWCILWMVAWSRAICPASPLFKVVIWNQVFWLHPNFYTQITHFLYQKRKILLLLSHSKNTWRLLFYTALRLLNLCSLTS